MSIPEKSPRILLVRLSAIGDVIHAMPVACALRERFPQAYLAWAVEQRAGELIEGHPAIDQRIVLPRGWLRSPAGVWRLRKQLKDLAFDTAIDAQGLTKSAVVAWLSGAKRRIGMGGRWGREISRWLNNDLVDTDGLHAIERGLKLLEPLGIRSPAVRFDVPAAAADRECGRGADPSPGAGRRFCPGRIGRRLAVEALARRSLRRRGRLLGTPLEPAVAC